MKPRFLHTAVVLFIILHCPSANILAQWVQQAGPFHGSAVTSLFIDGDFMLVGTRISGSYRSLDGGTTWTRMRISPDTVYPSQSCFTKTGSTIIAGVHSKGLYRSDDNGDTWTEVYDRFRDPSPPATYTTSFVTARNRIWALGAMTSSSIDTGKRWSFFFRLGNLVSTGLVETESAIYLSADGSFDSTDMGSQLRFAAGVYKSTNDGASWSRCNQGLPSGHIRCLATSDAYLYAGAWPGVAVSDDGGSTWRISGDISINGKILCMVADRERVFAGTFDHGVIYSPDYGVTWRTLGKGLDSVTVYSLVTDQRTLFACTSNGLYRSDISSAVSVHDDADESGTLSVVPNPGSGLVTITSAHSDINLQSIRLVDMLGTSISAAPFIVNTIDSRSVTVDVSAHPDGLYTIQFLTARGLEHARIVVSR
jgi:photosystem II stability/assembly factor-like uncharacterized protein